MVACYAFERRRHRARLDAYHEPRSNAGTEHPERRARHGRSGFACRDQTDWLMALGESPLRKPSGVDRTKTSPDNGQEIESKISESVCQ